MRVGDAVDACEQPDRTRHRPIAKAGNLPNVFPPLLTEPPEAWALSPGTVRKSGPELRAHRNQSYQDHPRPGDALSIPTSPLGRQEPVCALGVRFQ